MSVTTGERWAAYNRTAARRGGWRRPHVRRTLRERLGLVVWWAIAAVTVAVLVAYFVLSP